MDTGPICKRRLNHDQSASSRVPTGHIAHSRCCLGRIGVVVGLGIGRRSPEAPAHRFLPGSGLEHQAASVLGHEFVESDAPGGIERAFAGLCESIAQFGLLTGPERRVAKPQQFVVE